MHDDRRVASLTVWMVRIVGLGIAVALLWWSSRLEREFQGRERGRVSRSTGACTG